MPSPSSPPTQRTPSSSAPSPPRSTNNDNDHLDETLPTPDTEYPASPASPPPSPSLSPSPPPSPSTKKRKSSEDDEHLDDESSTTPPGSPSKKSKISAGGNGPTSKKDSQVLPPAPASAPASPKRKASSDTFDDSICDCCVRPSKKQTSVHWPEDTRPIRHRHGKDTSVVTKFKDIPNVCPIVKRGDKATLQSFFDNSSDETKCALKYLSPTCMNYIAHFLPPKYQMSFVSIAKKFRLAARGELIDLPDVDERKMLKRELLETLATLDASLVVCQDCEATHQYHTKFPNCGSTWPISQLNGYQKTTTFASIQVAVKKARDGLISPYKHLRTLQRRSVDYIDQDVCQVSFVDPFFVDDNDRLMIREQRWIITNFECEDLKKTMQRFLADQPLRSDTLLCRHLRELYDYRDLYDCGRAKVRQTEIDRCYECEFEFQVNATAVGAIGWALVITTWRDLGRCVSAYDPRFQTHFAEYDGLNFSLEHGKCRSRCTYGPPIPRVRRQVDGDDNDEDSRSESDSEEDDDSEDAEDVDEDYEAEEEDAEMLRGWVEDEEDETSDLPPGGIRDAYETNGFDLDDCLDENDLKAMLRKKRTSIYRLQKMAKFRKWKKKLTKAESDFKLMPKLKRWGGNVNDVVDLYKRADKT